MRPSSLQPWGGPGEAWANHSPDGLAAEGRVPSASPAAETSPSASLSPRDTWDQGAAGAGQDPSEAASTVLALGKLNSQCDIGVVSALSPVLSVLPGHLQVTWYEQQVQETPT